MRFCVFFESLKFVRRSRERSALVISGNQDKTVVGKRMVTAIAEMCSR